MVGIRKLMQPFDYDLKTLKWQDINWSFYPVPAIGRTRASPANCVLSCQRSVGIRDIFLYAPTTFITDFGNKLNVCLMQLWKKFRICMDLIKILRLLYCSLKVTFGRWKPVLLRLVTCPRFQTNHFHMTGGGHIELVGVVKCDLCQIRNLLNWE